MDKAKIVDLVSRQLCHYDYCNGNNDAMARLNGEVESVLTAAGHFDLLAERDALRKVVKAAREFSEKALYIHGSDDIAFENLYYESMSRIDKALADLDALGGGNGV